MEREDLACLANPTGRKTLAGVIEYHAGTRPAAPAFFVDGGTLNWRQYHQWSDALAAALLEQGLRRGDRIGLLLADGFEIHLAFVACEKAGLVGVAISPRAGLKEMIHLLNVSGAIALLSGDELKDWRTAELYRVLQQSVPALQAHRVLRATLEGEGALSLDHKPLGGQPSAARDFLSTRLRADELFLINSTSGTTGTPKCVQQHQARWFEFVSLVQDSAPLTGDDVFLCALPAAMGFGLWSGHFAPAMLGAPTVLLPSFSVEGLLENIQEHRVSVLSAVSTQFIMMINHPDLDRYDLSSLKVLYTGGERVPYAKAQQFEAATGAKVLQFYGSNEAGAVSYTTLRDSQELRLTTAGRIVSPQQIRLFDEQGREVAIPGTGQPICKGPSMSYGYYNNDEANRRLFTTDGWMKVEDIVSIDADGYLRVTGRAGDFIIRGGKNISSAAVEEAVLQHPRVRMVAAVAMPDPVFGERVCAYVALKAGDALGVAELAEFLQAQGVSKEYFPERVIVLDELPTSAGGKVAKQVLRDRLKEESGGPDR